MLTLIFVLRHVYSHGFEWLSLASSCENYTYVFEISWMCVSRLENCNKWRRMWKNRVEGIIGWWDVMAERKVLEPGERESAPIWRIETAGVLHSGVMGQARCWCDYSGIPDNLTLYRQRGFPTLPHTGGRPMPCHGDWQLRIGVGCAGDFLWICSEIAFLSTCWTIVASQHYPSFAPGRGARHFAGAPA
jgi:hypothetical protein